jgi:hypothetical protein
MLAKAHVYGDVRHFYTLGLADGAQIAACGFAPF